jgi:uncharacterized protein (DUF983 family)
MRKVDPLLAGLAGRCPHCAQGALFSGFIKVAERCAVCGLDLSPADSGDGPVVFILLIVGAVGCAGLFFTEIALHPPVWVELAIWLPATAVLTLLALRPLKGLMLAQQFRMRAGEARLDDEP